MTAWVFFFLLHKFFSKQTAWSNVLLGDFGFCLSTIRRRTTQVCWRPICTPGINCSIGHAAPKVWCGAKRITQRGWTSDRSNNSHQKWPMVQIKEQNFKGTKIHEIHQNFNNIQNIMSFSLACSLFNYAREPFQFSFISSKTFSFCGLFTTTLVETLVRQSNYFVVCQMFDIITCSIFFSILTHSNYSCLSILISHAQAHKQDWGPKLWVGGGKSGGLATYFSSTCFERSKSSSSSNLKVILFLQYFFFKYIYNFFKKLVFFKKKTVNNILLCVE